MKKRFLLDLCLAILLFTRYFAPVSAHGADSTVLLINQVRGEECCEVGNVENTQLQLQKLQELHVPVTFALRYDALKDTQYTSLFQNQTEFEVGVFLEITPQLAQDAQVQYKGPNERWYKAQNVYLLGYSPEDRIKIIDTVFTQFKKVFGRYPTTTVGWMIDATSLQYMVEKYGVKLHEITREQWGTDSYTLSGGPVNNAYFPSKEWPLIPGQNKEDTLPVVIVRQTVTDPLFNYGDTTSTFTSQANDYLRGKRDINYFNHVIEAGVEQQLPFGMAVVGLENSMAQDPYQDEFLRQIDGIQSMQKEGKVSLMTGAEWAAHCLEQFPENPLSLLFDQQDDKAAYWVTTPFYRARLIRNQGKMIISDLRVYNPKLQDPYKTSPTSVANAYWVTPFIFDSSRYFSVPEETFIDKVDNRIEKIKKFFSKEKSVEAELEHIRNDFDAQPIGIQLPDSFLQHAIMIEYSENEVTLHYLDQDQKPVDLIFSSQDIQVKTSRPSEVHIDTDPRLVRLKEIGISVEKQESNGTVTLHPALQLTQSYPELIAKYPDLFAPELNQDPPAREKSEIIFSNTHAIAGRNPIRIVLRLKTKKGETTLLRDLPQVKFKDGNVDEVKVQQPEGSRGEYYIDLIDNEEKTVKPILVLDNQEWELQNVHFVPNCKDEQWKCVNKPVSLLRFIWTKVQDVLNKR